MIKNTKKHQVNLYLTEHQISELKRIGELKEVPYSQLVREAVNIFIKKYPNKE